VRSAPALYFASLLRSYLLSPSMYAGLVFFAGFLGLVGAYGARMPLPEWFSMTYLMFTFAVAGGLSRTVVVGSGAFSYLIRHAGISPVELTGALAAASVISQVALSPLFLAVLALAYLASGGSLPGVDAGLFASAVVLCSLFMAALGVSLGLLMVGRSAASRLANFIPSLALILYFASLLTPAELRPYNPVTAVMILLASSLGSDEPARIFMTPSSPGAPTLAATVLAWSATLLILSILLMRRVREVNIYDVAMG